MANPSSTSFLVDSSQQPLASYNIPSFKPVTLPFNPSPAKDSINNPPKKIVKRNKQKHNETERIRREHLAQLFGDIRLELQSLGQENLDLENRNAVLETALFHLRRLKLQQSPSNNVGRDIPGLEDLLSYIENLRLQAGPGKKGAFPSVGGITSTELAELTNPSAPSGQYPNKLRIEQQNPQVISQGLPHNLGHAQTETTSQIQPQIQNQQQGGYLDQQQMAQLQQQMRQQQLLQQHQQQQILQQQLHQRQIRLHHHQQQVQLQHQLQQPQAQTQSQPQPLTQPQPQSQPQVQSQQIHQQRSREDLFNNYQPQLKTEGENQYLMFQKEADPTYAIGSSFDNALSSSYDPDLQLHSHLRHYPNLQNPQIPSPPLAPSNGLGGIEVGANGGPQVWSPFTDSSSSGGGSPLSVGGSPIPLPLPPQPTLIADFSRALFCTGLVFGVWYSWGGNTLQQTNEFLHIGRVLQENTPLVLHHSLSYLSWDLFAGIYKLIILLLLIGAYLILVIMVEPVLHPSSFFFQEAHREHQLASSQKVEVTTKHHLRALALLGRTVPSGVSLVANIAFQLFRCTFHYFYLGVYLDRLALIGRGGEASHKKAADLYLCLIRSLNGRIRGWKLFYVYLCAINISQLLDNVWLSEVYSHIAFFTTWKNPEFRPFAFLFLHLAWRKAKGEDQSRLVWLMFATAHSQIMAGNLSEAEIYLGRCLTQLKNNDTSNEVEELLLEPSSPTCGLSLYRYALLAQATVQWGLGNLAQSLYLCQITDVACQGSTSSGQTLRESLLSFPPFHLLLSPQSKSSNTTPTPSTSSSTPSTPSSAKTSPKNLDYLDPLCARWSAMLGAQCLLALDRLNDALALLRGLEVQAVNATCTSFPFSQTERISLDGLLALAILRILYSSIYLNNPKSVKPNRPPTPEERKLFSEGVAAAERALSQTEIEKVHASLRVFTWVVYQAFAEAWLVAWDLQISFLGPPEDKDCDWIGRRALTALQLVERRGKGVATMHSQMLRLKATAAKFSSSTSPLSPYALPYENQNTTFIGGMPAKAASFNVSVLHKFEEALQTARSHHQAYEEGRILLEIGTLKGLTCRCPQAEGRDCEPSCGVGAMREARKLFMRCGAVYGAKIAASLIRESVAAASRKSSDL